MNLHRLLASTSFVAMIVAANTAPSAVLAAQSSESQDRSAQVEEVVVTGTRVVRDGYDAPTPTTVIGAEILEQRASLTIVDALQTMPSFRGVSTPSTGTQAVAGTAGASFLNLRGLGSNRTLILIDGQRVVPTTSQGQVDVAILPTFILKRVDVVTGGASASWGSDAVAGVANFVLDNTFKGFKASAAAGVAGAGDGGNSTLSAVYGGSALSDRLHVVIGAEHHEHRGVGAQAREQNQGDTAVIANPAYVAGNGQPRLLLSPHLFYASPFVGMVASGVAKGTLFNTDGSISNSKFQFCTAAAVADRSEICGGPKDDRAFITQWTVLRGKQKRNSGYANIAYDLTDSARIYANVLYGDTMTRINAGGTPVSWLLPAGTYRVNLSSAFVPTALRSQLTAAGETSVVISKTFLEIPAAVLTQRNKTERFVTGIDGELGAGWKYSAHYERGETNGYFEDAGLSRIPRMLEAWDAVAGPNGSLVCRSSLSSPANGCVPSNPFASTPKTAAELAYYIGTAWARLNIVENAAAMSVTGEPVSTWAGPVSVALGLEYRKDEANQISDPVSQARGWALANPQALSGALDTKEVFGEAVIPLAKDIPLAKNLDVSVAGRQTDYSYSGKANTWKVGVNYSPTSDLRFRMTRSRDIRAPNILEIYNPGTQSSSAATDPRTNTTVAFQAILSVGNRDLRPEVADTTAYGVVYQPSFLPRFSVSVDAYDIQIEDAIAQISVQEILNRCASGNQELCALVSRDAAGIITGIRNPNLNLRTFATKGLDIEASYGLSLGDFNQAWAGDLQFRALINHVTKYETGDGITKIDQAGAIASNQPKWVGDFSATYTNGPIQANLGVVYTGSGTFDNQYIEGVDINDNSVESVTRVNGQVSYDFDLGGRKLNYFFNVDNIFDVGPPVELPVNGGNYDRVGRRYVTGVRIRF